MSVSLVMKNSIYHRILHTSDTDRSVPIDRWVLTRNVWCVMC